MLARTCVAEPIALQNDFCAATFDPATLTLNFASHPWPAICVSSAQTNVGTFAVLETNATLARVSFPEKKISITVTLDGNRLSAHMLALEPGAFKFPVLCATEPTKGWILPFFEGVYVPMGDEEWASFLLKYGPMNTTADLGLPFVGLDFGSFTLTCLFTNPFNNELTFSRKPDGRLNASLTHQFTRNHPIKEYGVVFQVGTNSLVEPARIYREWLIGRGELREPQGKNPPNSRGGKAARRGPYLSLGK